MTTGKKIRLNNCVQMPIVGLGTCRVEPNKMTEVVKSALNAGYKHFDCAFIYGNEREIGAALQEKLREHVVSEREDLFITNKLWDTYHEPARVREACVTSLRQMQLAYFDMYLMHWPTALKYSKEGGYPKDSSGNVLFADVDFVDTWRAMEELIEEGLCRCIGLSNFNQAQIERILKEGRIRPANLQIECHPYFNQKSLIDYCNAEKIVVTAYSPLGAPNSPALKKGEYALLQNPTVQSIAHDVNRSVAQVLLRYQLQRDIIVIPMSQDEHHMAANLQLFDFELSEKQMEELNALDCNGRFNLHLNCLKHPHYPFDLAEEDAKPVEVEQPRFTM